MTYIKKIKFRGLELYRVWEYGSFGVRIRDCTLNEVMYILSTKEQE